ncbi:MAG: segregation/condensation protein A [Candidatus Krumholzibacteriota bacterium]|nr:segregation/condensation protein A [Candidatus Krumholzibacteriota bacterium]
MVYQIRLTQFEGPLDLLLHLIRRDKINIYDIPISHIIKEYLSYIEVMEKLQLEIAGEFFVMAATLMRIKAQMLLPRRDDADEEDEDPREELVTNLIEYRKYKEAAIRLAKKETDRRNIFTRPSAKRPPAEDDPEDRKMEVSVFDLVDAFKKVMDQLKNQISYRIDKESFTIEEKIESIRDSIEDRSEILFSELFKGVFDKLEVIVTFLAVLELVKSGFLAVRQMSMGNDLWLYRQERTESADDERKADGVSA